MKKIVLIGFLSLLSLPIFSQTITIDKSQLEKYINEEVQKRISSIVDSAVAIAIKDEETKYLTIIADKDKQIVDLQAQIDKDKISQTNDDIKYSNLKIDFDTYKKQHGLSRDLTIGGLSFSGGSILGIIGGIVFTLKVFK